MAIDRRWLALMAAGFAVVLLLGQLPRLAERTAERREAAAAVFTPQRVEKLTDDRLVDAFIALPLEPRLSRVAWDHNILSVDLTYSTGAGSVRDVWADSAELVRLAFVRLTNVQELLIRVFSESDGRKTLLFAADTRAGDWSSLEITELQPSADGSAPDWSDKLHSVWTSAGERWRRNFANS
jgi:hypothetical protein